MEDDKLRIVIVGHVDHGKSTLIGRLFYDTGSLPEEKLLEISEICESLGKDLEFGYVMDHLEEERAQGVTIETSQAFFKTSKRDYVIIDAPGHVEFVKNMISGASQADAAILIVDVVEGVKEQTKRHAYILSMLGLQQVIVVINKMDIIDYDKKIFSRVKKEVSDFLSDIKIAPSQAIPVSAKNGDLITKKSSSLGWYEGPTLLEALDNFHSKESASEGPMRFVVQDVYNFDKRIVVGRVESGVIKKGNKVKILPSGEETEIKGIEEFLKDDVSEAEAGKATGLTTVDTPFIDRGDVIVSGEKSPLIRDVIDANIFWMDQRPYHKGESVLFRCATQEVPCKIVEIKRILDSSSLEILSLDSSEIKNREVAQVVIKTSKPVVVEDFNTVESLGRFVLTRDDTIAGGIIRGG